MASVQAVRRYRVMQNMHQLNLVDRNMKIGMYSWQWSYWDWESCASIKVPIVLRWSSVISVFVFFLNLKVLIDQGPMTEVANEVQAAVFISGSLFI